MEYTRKQLKLASIIVLIFAALSLLQVVTDLFTSNFDSTGATETVLLVTRIIVIVISFILLLPNIYIGVKGMSLAKEPKVAKAHIVWAVILLVFAVLSIISPTMSFIQNGFKLDNSVVFFTSVAEILAFIDYIKYASDLNKQLAK